MIISSGNPINTVEDWFMLTPPKEGANQWRDGRSAKELAKAFFPNGAAGEPAELVELPGSGRLVGPFMVPGGGLVPGSIPPFIGKAVRAVA